MRNALAVFVVLALAVGITVLSADWLVIAVDEQGPDGVRLRSPIPLGVAQFALALTPVEILNEHIPAAPEFAAFHPHAISAIDALEKAGDADLIEVRDGNEHVTVRKVGGSIWVEVEDGRDQVRLRVPMEALRGFVNAYDGERFNVAGLLSVMGSFPSGDIVHVRDPDTEVRVSIW